MRPARLFVLVTVVGAFAAGPEVDAQRLGLLGAIGVEVRRFSVGFRGERSFRNLVDSGALPTSPLDNSGLWTASVSIEYLVRVL